jgi:hypothetical protein
MPNGILLQEIDIHIDWLAAAIHEFGESSSAALESAAISGPQEEDPNVDIMPREEVFLISSFVMNLRHGAAHTLAMLRHARHLVEERADREGRKLLHFPRIKLRKWLFSGQEEPGTAQVFDRETFVREQGNSSEENFIKDRPKKRSLSRRSSFTGPRLTYEWRRCRRVLGKVLDWLANSDSFIYAFKFMLGVMLVSWPAFVPSWNGWYLLNRGGV